MENHTPLLASRTPLAQDAREDDEDAVCLQAQQLMFAYNASMVLRAAIQLGLLDTLCAAAATDGSWLTADELAQEIDAPDKTKVSVSSVDRILRYLACFNVVRCSTTEKAGLENGTVLRRYAAAPVCRWLTTKNNGKGTLGVFSLFIGERDHILPWHHIAEAVVSGETTPFEHTHGLPFFEHTGKKNPQLGVLFDHAMAEHSVILVSKLLEHFKGFGDVRQLVDVGGGTGNTLQMITSKYKDIKGINFDLPHVISQAPSIPGVEHVAGDMYESVPSGDACLIQWILIMLSDEQCIRLLKNCYQALPTGGKVIIVDGILPETPNASSAADRDSFTLDICGLVVFGGKQRTEKEYAMIARESGFTRPLRSTYIFLNFYAIEFTK